MHFTEPKPLRLSLSQHLVDDERIPVPYFLAGDDAFSLEPNVMKPFPKELSQMKKESSTIGFQGAGMSVRMFLAFSPIGFTSFNQTR